MQALRNAFINIRRSPYQALLVIFIISLTFAIGYIVSLAIYASNIALNEVESQPQVVAFFKLDTPEQKLKQITDEVNNLSYTKSVTLITQEEALKLYKEENQDEPLLLELVTADILPASIEVSTYKIDDLDKIKDKLNQYSEIDEVVYQQDVISALTKAIKTIKTVGVVTVIILGSISFITMVIIIALKVSGKRKTIRIMRLVGASSGFIRKPYILEGAIYSLVGSTVGFGIMLVVLYFGLPQLTQTLQIDLSMIQFTPTLLAWFYGVGTLSGMTLGAFAGLLAVNRLIKR